MNILAKYWASVLLHAFVVLSSSLLFLFVKNPNPDNLMYLVAIPLLLAGLIQVLVWWKNNWSGKGWLPRVLMIVFDLGLGTYVIYEHVQSLELLLFALGIWSFSMSVYLFAHYVKAGKLRIPIALSGAVFFAIAVYLIWQAGKSSSSNPVILGTILAGFSLFLFLISIELRKRHMANTAKDVQKDNQDLSSR